VDNISQIMFGLCGKNKKLKSLTENFIYGILHLQGVASQKIKGRFYKRKYSKRLLAVMLCFGVMSIPAGATLQVICFPHRCHLVANRNPNPPYRFGRRLVGGIEGRHFFIGNLSTQGTNTHPNRDLTFRNAIADWNWVLSRWNATPNRLDRKGVTFNFTRTNNINNAQIRVWQGYYNETWTGLVQFQNDNAAGNHRFAHILYNLNARIHANSLTQYNLRLRRVFNHEIGHVLGLAHSNGDRHIMWDSVNSRVVITGESGDRGQIMNPFWDITTANVPTRRDVGGVIDIYCSACRAGTCSNPQSRR